MSQQGMRSFSTEFKEAVVRRLEAGERIAAVSDELRIRRKLLFEWRAAYRKLGAAGLNRKRGRKPGFAHASPDAAPATPAPLTELARAQARIVELERKIGKQQMDIAAALGTARNEHRPRLFRRQRVDPKVFSREPDALAAIIRGLAIDNARAALEKSAVAVLTDNTTGTAVLNATTYVATPAPAAAIDATSSGGAQTSALSTSLGKIDNAFQVLSQSVNNAMGRLGLRPIVNAYGTQASANVLPAQDLSATSASGTSAVISPPQSRRSTRSTPSSLKSPTR